MPALAVAIYVSAYWIINNYIYSRADDTGMILKFSRVLLPSIYLSSSINGCCVLCVCRQNLTYKMVYRSLGCAISWLNVSGNHATITWPTNIDSTFFCRRYLHSSSVYAHTHTSASASTFTQQERWQNIIAYALDIYAILSVRLCCTSRWLQKLCARWWYTVTEGAQRMSLCTCRQTTVSTQYICVAISHNVCHEASCASMLCTNIINIPTVVRHLSFGSILHVVWT